MPIDNVYLNTEGQFYRSDYPFSVRDSLVPFVTQELYNLLGQSSYKPPNASQRRIVLTDLEFTQGADIRNGRDSVTPTLRRITRELRQYGGELIVLPGDYRCTGQVPYWPNFTVRAPQGGARFYREPGTWDSWTDPDDGPSLLFSKGSFFSFYTEFDPNVSMTRVDADVLFDGLNFDYGYPYDGLTGGGAHALRAFGGKRITVQNCNFADGENAVAHVNCDLVLVKGNKALRNTNCSWDNWGSPGQTVIVNNFSYTLAAAQTANYNPEGNTKLLNFFGITNSGLQANGLIFAHNVLISDEADATPAQFECLGNLTSTRNLLITGNRFVNGILVCRGDISDVTITDNQFVAPQGGSNVIISYPWAPAPAPANIKITDNQIFDPTTNNAFGVIRCQGVNSEVATNRVYGNTYGAVNGIYTTEYGCRVEGNFVSNGIVATPGAISGYFDYTFLSSKMLRWIDTSAQGLAAMFAQTDKNFILRIYDASFNPRTIFSIFSQSDTTELQWLIETKIRDRFYFAPLDAAATGTTIGTAATPFSNAQFVRITSSNPGVDDGVVASNPTGGGLIYGLFNDSGNDINFYPPNTGTGRIDGGAIGTPMVVPSGTRVLFGSFSSAQIATLAVRP